MYESTRKRILKALFSCVSIGIILSVLQAAPEDKLTPAELVAKHLESIGSAVARAKVRWPCACGIDPLVDWTFNLNQFEFNASLEPAAFTIGHEQKN
jgi:hypothetical protein